MKTLWYIAKKDLLQLIKDRNALIFLLAMPLILIAVVGAAFGSFLGNNASPIAINIAVSNLDKSTVGNAVVNALKINNKQLTITLTNYSDSAQVSQQVKDGHADAGVVIPAGTTDALTTASAQGTPTQHLVQFYALPNSTQGPTTIAQQLVTNVVNQLVNAYYVGSAAVAQVNRVCNQPGNHCAQSTLDPASISQAVGRASTSSQTTQVALNSVGQVTQINGFDQVVPGYAIFFALFGINSAAATILQEKEDGTFRRLLIAPIHKYALLGGKMLAQFLLTLAQLVVLFGVGFFLFHLHITSWPVTILLLIGASFATTGLGMALVSLVKSRRQLGSIVVLVTLVTSAIGGAWWPLWLEPVWLQNMAKLGVTAWAMEGLNGTIIYGKDFMGVLPDILGLLGYGLICFVIALRFFRFQQKTA